MAQSLVDARLILVLCFAAGLALSARGEAVISTRSGNGITVEAKSYSAALDAAGNLTGVTVHGLKTVAHQFAPGTGAASVNTIAKTVAVRSGAARVEWTFNEETIHVLTEGYEFNFQFDPASTRSAIVPGGRSEMLERPGVAVKDVTVPNSTALALTNGLTIQFTTPFHVMGAGRLVPTCYCNSSLKPGQLMEFDLKLGAVASGAELLNDFALQGVGADDGPLNQNGNRSRGIVHFPEKAKIALAGRVVNVGTVDTAGRYRLAVVDHYEPWGGKVVFQESRDVTFKAGMESVAQFDAPALPSGFYYATLELWNDAGKVFETKLTFAVDLPHYSHALTRPADFEDFWEQRDRELQLAPCNAVVTPLSDPSNANKAYEVKFDCPRAGPVTAFLKIGADVKAGIRAPALISPQIAGPFNAERDALKGAGFACSGITLEPLLPGDAVYTIWNSVEESNLLACILTELRCVDYLASRADVLPHGIRLFGASRSGPLAFITAARRPRNVSAIEFHVPTSAGISWTDKPYYSWGMPLGYSRAPEELARFARLSTYVDPVNHAPDVIAPVIMAYGIDDGLSRPEGIEAMYHLTAARWKRIARNGGGHQFSPEFQALEKELAEYVADGRLAPAQEAILKQH